LTLNICMKNTFWKIAMVLSIVTMMTGFLIALYGVHYHDYEVAYAGVLTIIITCVAWWIWVMLTIRAMWEFTQNTVEKVYEIRVGVKEVKVLFEEYKKLKDR